MLSYINRQNVHLYKYKFLSKLALLYNLRWKAQHVLDAEVCDVMLNLLCSFPAAEDASRTFVQVDAALYVTTSQERCFKI